MVADQPRFSPLINIALCHLRMRNVASAEIMACRAATMPNADQGTVAYILRQAEEDHPLRIAD